MGSEELRETLGRVMDEVTAGREILITRRGKPRMRLLPPAPGDASATPVAALQQLLNVQISVMPAG